MIKSVILNYLKIKYGFTGNVVSYEDGSCRIQRFDNYGYIEVTWSIEYRDNEIALTNIKVNM